MPSSEPQPAPSPGRPREEGTKSRPKSPLVLVDSECPVCSTKSRQPCVRKTLFEVVETDVTGNTLRVKWSVPEFAHVRPKDYDLWFCPHCHFSDLSKTFTDPSVRGRHFDLLQEAVLALAAQPKSPLGLIGRAVDLGVELVSPSTAYLCTLAAILAQTSVKTAYRDVERLAHLYLRAASYLQEHQASEILDARVLVLVQHVRTVAPALPANADEAARTAIRHLDTLVLDTREMEPRREVRLLGIMARLQRPIGTPAEALPVARRWYERVLALRTSIRATLERDRNLPGGERDKMSNLLEWLGHQSEEAREMHVALAEEVERGVKPS